jgi:hypothetical protein
MKSNTDPVIAGIGRVESSLKTATDKLKGFDTLLKISLGVGAGNLIEGLGRQIISGVAGGFVESAKAGNSFFTVLADSGKAAIGLKTSVQEAAEAMQRLQQLSVLNLETTKLIMQLRGQVPQRIYQFLTEKEEADVTARMKELEEAKQASMEAGAPWEETEKIIQEQERLRNEVFRLQTERQKDAVRRAELQSQSRQQNAADDNLAREAQQEDEMADRPPQFSVAQWRAMTKGERDAIRQRRNENQAAEQNTVKQREAEMIARQKDIETRGAAMRQQVETPQERVAREAQEAEQLYRQGGITREQRDRRFKQLEGEAGEEEKDVRRSPQFVALEQMSRTIQGMVNQEDTPKKQLITLGEIRTILHNIEQKPAVAQFS